MIAGSTGGGGRQAGKAEGREIELIDDAGRVISGNPIV
ncbi:UNVERIFIED_ORG: hypothetical protein M2442_005374, partial [Methylorubrum zatmanii]|nr:hypothetical protein [Methylorubrum zatmanii]